MQAPTRRPGRPKRLPDQTFVKFGLFNDQLAYVKATAEKRGVDQVDIMREAVELHRAVHSHSVPSRERDAL